MKVVAVRSGEVDTVEVMLSGGAAVRAWPASEPHTRARAHTPTQLHVARAPAEIYAVRLQTPAPQQEKISFTFNKDLEALPAQSGPCAVSLGWAYKAQ